MKGKRREDPRSLLKDMRMLALSAYAHQFKILLGRIDSLAQAAVSGVRRLSPNAKTPAITRTPIKTAVRAAA
jgi:hypothetical protein